MNFDVLFEDIFGSLNEIILKICEDLPIGLSQLSEQEMRPLFLCGWPLNFPIRDGVFNYSYNLGSQSIVILFISMQICSDRTNAAQLLPY